MTVRISDSTDRLAALVQSRLAARATDRDAGMTTAEYAVGTVAACGFGGVMYKVLTSEELLRMIKDLMFKTIRSYFHF